LLPEPRRRDLASRTAGQRGQAAVSLLATLPALLAAIAIVAQVAVIGFAAWSAATAARAGARAELIGTKPEAAVRAALPPALARAARVRLDRGGGVEVRVRAPRLLPIAPSVPVVAAAGLDPEAGDGAR
jgi:hypothetical protein